MIRSVVQCCSGLVAAGQHICLVVVSSRPAAAPKMNKISVRKRNLDTHIQREKDTDTDRNGQGQGRRQG